MRFFVDAQNDVSLVYGKSKPKYLATLSVSEGSLFH